MFCRVLRASCLALMLLVSAGCGNAEYYRLKMDSARLLLQQNDDVKALEALSVTNDASAPAEYHYLKSVALDRLNRHEAATASIKRAVAAEDKNPKYKAYELKLGLFARDRNSVEQLIPINEQYGSIGTVALCGAYALQAKAMLLDSENRPQAAEFHRKRQSHTLDTALSLAKEMPELYRELITFAVQHGKYDDAVRLIDDILKMAPANVPMRNKKIQVLLAMKQPDDAVVVARELFAEQPGRPVNAAEAFASVLAAASPSERHDEEFQKLREEYPRSNHVLARHSAYLTRSGRMLEAFALIEAALPKQTTKAAREMLAFVAISLPLEIGSVDYTEQRLQKHRAEISDPLLVDYFEARLLFLKREHHEAIQKMLNIVAAERKHPGQKSELATEALSWIRRILAERVLTQQLERVVEKSRRPLEMPIAVETQPDDSAKPEEAKDAAKPEPINERTQDLQRPD